MPATVVTGSQVLGANEVLIATLPAWSPMVDVYVDATLDPKALGSTWSVYAVTAGTRTRLASGTYSTLGQAQRVLAAIPGLGSTIELRAKTTSTTAGAIRGAIVGYNPDEIPLVPSDVLDTTVSLVSGVRTPLGGVPWHPNAQIMVKDSPQGVLFAIEAVIAGFAVNVEIAQAAFGDVDPSRLVCNAAGGASSWAMSAFSPVGAAPGVKAALQAFSPLGGESSFAAGSVELITLPFLGTATTATVLPFGATLRRVALDIQQAFVGFVGPVILEVGYEGVPAFLMDRAKNDPATPNIYEMGLDVIWPVNLGVKVTLSNPGIVPGLGVLIVEFANLALN